MMGNYIGRCRVLVKFDAFKVRRFRGRRRVQRGLRFFRGLGQAVRFALVSDHVQTSPGLTST